VCKHLINQHFCNGSRQQQELKPTKFVYSETYLQQKKIHELKQKIREHIETKMIFKSM
jgi:hypothetical protein